MSHPNSQGCFCAECRGEDIPENLDTEPEPELPEVDVSAICDVVLEYVRTLTKTIKEQHDMIHRDKHKTTTSTDKSAGRGLDYLSIDDLSFDKQLVNIILARVQDDSKNEGKQLIAIKVKLGVNTYRLWNVRHNNPNFDILCDSLGEDETKWAGREILMFNERDELSDKVWMRSELPPKKSK